MECPFELPIYTTELPNRVGDFWIFNVNTAPLFAIENKQQADYIVQAINSHEKFKTALEKIVELETDCCPRCEGNGRLYADGKTHLISENADTIHCGNCGGSGRILPEDAQEIASEALEAEKQ